MKKKEINTAIAGTSNDAEEVIGMSNPYTVEVEIEGSADFLFHRWSNEAIDEKAKAAKGSKAKKTDDLESYVYRMPNGELAIPGEYLRMSIVNAAKFMQDPRSPRKSAMDIFKAGLISLTEKASIGKTKWDYEDRRRVRVQMSYITRARPAILKGYKARFQMMVNLPEYISPQNLNAAISSAGRLIGIGDFRPSYGRFQVTKFEVIN